MANAFDRFDVQGGEHSGQSASNPFDAFDAAPERSAALDTSRPTYDPPESLVTPEIKGLVVDELNERRAGLKVPDTGDIEVEREAIGREAKSLREMRGQIADEEDAKLFNERVAQFNDKLDSFHQRAQGLSLIHI